ncbi:MAG TPA: SAM-dependent methyltransferase [Terriglobales bacterium]|nr:SAM-dependent methyltransferase [Terriglobales bacterium]
MTLRQIIEREICERGPMPFSRYMELCLYHPELGYYSRNAEQFGKAGDFYTSSDVHAVFARLLARQFEQIWRLLESPARIEVLELGPGRGLFAQDVLDWSEKKFPEFFRALHYSLSERSPALRGKLKITLARFLENGRASVLLENQRENQPVPRRLRKGTASGASTGVLVERALGPEVPVIIFVNEFFDALPVEVLSAQGKLQVAIQEDRLIESWARPSSEELEYLDRYSVHPESEERIEVPLLASHYMAELHASMQTGLIIAIDYGYTRQEQLAGRHRGTIMAYRQHSASPNPYEAPGEQDLTAHVNFTALAAAAKSSGLQVQPLLTQSQFLMGIGENDQFTDAFEGCRLPQERAKVALQLKHLVTPAGMGENFQVMVASKGVSQAQLAELGGLTFGKREHA